MKCPRDETALTQVRLADAGLERCATCGGVWFDFMQMERALSRESAALKPLVPREEIKAEPDEDSLVCPRCHGALVRMRAMPENVTHYGCVSCYGRWLDGSQLARVAGRSLAVKFEQLFKTLLGT